jgi:hypothetical protein
MYDRYIHFYLTSFINRHSIIFRVDICATRWSSLIITTKQNNLLTLIQFNSEISVNLCYSHTSLKHVMLMYTLRAWDKYTDNDLRKFIVWTVIFTFS